MCTEQEPSIACRETECSKNHFEHFDVVEGEEPNMVTTKHAKIHFVHHKNDRIHGAVTLPVAPEVVEVLTMLEQAASFLTPICPTIWSSSFKEPYQKDYWSQIGKAALSLGVGSPCNARELRHEFSTHWRDFIDHAPSNVLQMLGTQLEAAAAFLMGNTPAAWDATYDDNMRTRAKERVLKLYPNFVEYVKSEHNKKKQVRMRNPHTTTS